MQGFYWVIEGLLAGTSRPGARPPRGTTDLAGLEEDLAFLRARGIRAVLSLTEEPLPAGALARYGIAEHHIPIVDMTAPTPADLDAALAWIDEHLPWQRAVAVHCLAGQGRTGTILAAYLIRDGRTPADAVRELRLVCPHAVENDLQLAALDQFHRSRPWVL